MTTDCYGVPVPPVPERPIDLNQPAYVLVDGRWIDLGEIISRYVPVVPGAGGVLQAKHVTTPKASLPNLPKNDMIQLAPVIEVMPRSPNSRLMAIATVSYGTVLSPRPDGPLNVQIHASLRYQTSTGVWDAGSDNDFFGFMGSYDRRLSDGTVIVPVTFQIDLGPSERRSNDGKWAIGGWGLVSLGSTVSGDSTQPYSPLHVSIFEYLPD